MGLMRIDYKKELETAAKRMILVHDPDVLIKMIVRTIVHKVQVTHASILLHRPDDGSYRLTVSRGSLGLKIPIGLVRVEKENPLIYFFKQRNEQLLFNDRVIMYDQLRSLTRRKNTEPKLKELLGQVLHQMELFDSVVCVPSMFRDELFGILLLGQKSNGRLFCREELDFFIALASHVTMAIRNAQLFKELERQLDKKHQLFIRTTIAFAAAIEAKDHYTHGHTTRVTNLSLELARRLKRQDRRLFNDKFLEGLHVASLLHDIGKIGISEAILNKEGVLSDEERARIREHPLIGVAILKPINELEDSILGIKYHHERHDGSGYPEGLKGDDIPLMASIISVADSFDAMTSTRPYRPCLYKDHAVEEIRRLSGQQFNPLVAGALVELHQEGRL
ncbi:MAG TPA: HD domain-containing phosphohydrolase [Patescibacteria group bacterium]|nr:HD domain-containing phosphohydrolase [Patescibacteria group bacterium]